jgi:hypothetical protein
MPKLDPTFLRQKLQEQRHLLGKSITEMKRGDFAEAVRVSVCLRILLHDRGTSKALLGQINQEYLDLEILDEDDAYLSQEAPIPGIMAAVFPNESDFLRLSVFEEKRVPSTLGRWWTRPSLSIPATGVFSREEIVLGLAHKEGGAHVDPTITEKYYRLVVCNSGMEGLGSGIKSLDLSRLVVGQAGLELLNFLDRHFP